MFGSGVDPDLRFGFRGLMRHGGDDAFDQFPGLDPHRLEFAPSLAREVEDRRYQPVHLGDRGFDEAERFGEIFRELLVGAFEHGLGGIGGVFRRRGAGGLARASVAIRLKMSPRNSSSSLVKPMMFTSGERRSWLTI